MFEILERQEKQIRPGPFSSIDGVKKTKILNLLDGNRTQPSSLQALVKCYSMWKQTAFLECLTLLDT